MDLTKDSRSELPQEQFERRRQRGLDDLVKIVNRCQHSVYGDLGREWATKEGL